MTRRANVITAVLWCSSLCVITAGCTRTAEAPATEGTNQGAQRAPARQSPPGPAQGLAIEFVSEPDPPTAGDNSFEVTVEQADGSPVSDATVTAVFSMPAMPAMNMPAMQSTATLAHQTGGRYRGSGQLSMRGTWYVTVTVTRGSEELGSRNFSVVAK